MTEVIKRRRRVSEPSAESVALVEVPANAVKRYGCTACFESFYAVEVEPCPVCGGDSEPIPTYGPVPGKFTKKNTTGQDAHAVILTLRLSQDVADRVEAMRGDEKRSAWLRKVVARAVGMDEA